MVDRLNRQIGFAWSMRTTAFLILALMIIANLTITSRMPPNRAASFRLGAFAEPLKELRCVLTVFGSFLFYLGTFMPINYIATEAISYGMNESLATYLVSILNTVSLFGRILPGYIAEKIGRFNVMILTCFLSSLHVLALWIPAKSNARIIVFAALYGFASGAFVSMAPSVIAQISGVRKIGVRTGTFFAMVSVAGLVSNPIGGALVERWEGGYGGLQVFSGVMMAGGAGVIVAARVRLGGVKVRVKV